MTENKNEDHNSESHSSLNLLPPPAVGRDLAAGLLDLNEAEDVHGDQEDERKQVKQHQAQ